MGKLGEQRVGQPHKVLRYSSVQVNANPPERRITVCSSSRSTGPIRRRSISHCRAPSSQTPLPCASAHRIAADTGPSPSPRRASRTRPDRCLAARPLKIDPAKDPWPIRAEPIGSPRSECVRPLACPHYVPLVGPVLWASSSRCRAASARSRVSPNTHLC